MNAIPHRRQPQAPDAAERTARHLRLCQELIETGMDLARAAAERAKADINAPPPGRMPGSAAAIEQAQDLARRRAPDCARTFTLLARAVRQTMLLETCIAEGRVFILPDRPAPSDPAPNTDPTAHHPDHPHPETPRHDAPRRETLERLDHDALPDPDDDDAVETMIRTIGHTFGTDLPTAAPPPKAPGTVSRLPHNRGESACGDVRAPERSGHAAMSTGAPDTAASWTPSRDFQLPARPHGPPPTQGHAPPRR